MRARQILRGRVSQAQIARVHLDIDGRGLSLVQDGVLHGAALEERPHFREFRRNLLLARDPCIRSC